MLGKWETKCLGFWRQKCPRKSPAAYQEAQIKKRIFAGHSWGTIEPIEILFFSPPFGTVWKWLFIRGLFVKELFAMWKRNCVNKLRMLSILCCWIYMNNGEKNGSNLIVNIHHETCTYWGQIDGVKCLHMLINHTINENSSAASKLFISAPRFL